MNGEAHRVFTYPFYHSTSVQLLLNIGVLVTLCGSFEKSVGTVRFLFLFVVLSTCTGLCYALCDLFLHDATQNPAEGLVPTALALVAVTTMHTRMAKGFFFGVSIPTASVLEKVTPFRFLRNIPGVRHVPASPEERRKTILPEINPTPGSYPVQAYAPLSSVNAQGTTTGQTYEGWPRGTGATGRL
ncbi:hypothetical protein CRUP_032063 [Coryphaenoides rupestris]|nr:hypothetical protein CRUP_032063 [Coryphaenoides rupestris]